MHFTELDALIRKALCKPSTQLVALIINMRRKVCPTSGHHAKVPTLLATWTDFVKTESYAEHAADRLVYAY